jgi:hypothetical protein
MSTPVILRIPQAAKHINELAPLAQAHYKSEVNAQNCVMASLYVIANQNKDEQVIEKLVGLDVEFEQGGELEFF